MKIHPASLRSASGGGRIPAESRPRGSAYLDGIRQCAAIWAASAALALFFTLVTYPGIWYSDSYVRVSTAYAVGGAIKSTLTGHGRLLETGNAFTVIPSFFLSLSLMMTGHVAFYTFCQAFGFFAAVFLLIRELGTPHWKVQAVLFAISPVIYGASVYYEANVGSLIGMIMLTLLLRRCGTVRGALDRVMEFCLIALSALITFGYRTNAFTVLPVLVGYLFLSARKRGAKIGKALLALAVGIVLVWAIPAVFQVVGDSNASTGFVWEMLTTIQRMEPEAQKDYVDYLDDIGGEGATQAALESSTEASANGFMWGGGLTPSNLSAPGTLSKVIGKYFRLLAERPGDWIGTKLDFVGRAMGVQAPLDLYEYPYDRWDRMTEFGMVDTAQRRFFHSSVLRENEVLGFFTCRPWVAFLVSVVMLAAEVLRKSRKRELYALVFLLAVFYYLAYLLVIVGFEQRMFYPSLVLLMAMDASITMEWIYGLAKKVRHS